MRLVAEDKMFDTGGYVWLILLVCILSSCGEAMCRPEGITGSGGSCISDNVYPSFLN